MTWEGAEAVNAKNGCPVCGARVTLKDQSVSKHEAVWHRSCYMAEVVVFVACGCEYCKTVQAAISDANEHHKTYGRGLPETHGEAA